jgi:flagellar M-ring protein FliF
MNQLLRLWNSLTIAQRISLIVVPLLLAVAVAAGIRWKHEADFRTLYSSLTPEDASAVTQKIREAGIEYRLDETGATVLVPSDRIAEARLALAGAGMPRSGRIGFELFDRTNLGASDFTEQVNYQRALEGELERTVSTLVEVEQARIHITPGKESVFLDSRQPAKATVVLKLRREAHIQQSSVTAIANLVASAVDGLGPEAVSIVDDSGRLLNRPRASDGEAKAAEVNLEYRQQLESELQAKLSAALEPLLGPGKFRTGVNIDCDFTSVDQNDEIYSESEPVPLVSQTTEESTGNGVSGGTPGTASNLPNPPQKASGGTSGTVRKTENVSYQPSRTIRHTVSPKGVIRKISTIVLVDHTVHWEGAGAKARKIIVPPSAEVLKAVHDVVAGIVAYDEPRGDQITVQSLPFEGTVDAEPPMSSSGLKQKNPGLDRQQLMIIGGAALLVILLAAGALFMMRRKSGRQKKASDTAPTAVTAGPASSGTPGEIPAPEGAPIGGTPLPTTEAASLEQAREEAEILGRIKLPAASKAAEVLIRHVRESALKHPAAAASVLRAWISETEGKAT